MNANVDSAERFDVSPTQAGLLRQLYAEHQQAQQRASTAADRLNLVLSAVLASRLSGPYTVLGMSLDGADPHLTITPMDDAGDESQQPVDG